MRGRGEKRRIKENESQSELAECYVCGQNHSTELCPFFSNQLCTVEDAPTPSHARLTLPPNLEVQDLSDGTTTVVARTKFPQGTRFGPFQAALTSMAPPEVNFPLKIFGNSEEDSFYLDTRNEDHCNWMCLVAAVSSSSDVQNLICYQVRRELFFSSVRDIEPGEKLKVWYAPFYGVKMGISPEKFADSASLASQDMMEIDGATEAEGPVAWEADTTTADIPPSEEEALAPASSAMRTGLRQKKKEPRIEKDDIQQKKEMLEKAVTAYVAQQLPAERLGARFAPACWRCRECGVKEVSVISYAQHLMQHLKPSAARIKNFPCSLCHKKFYTKEQLDEHEGTRHGLSGLLPPLPQEPAIENSADVDDPMPLQDQSQEQCQPTEVDTMPCLSEKPVSQYVKEHKSQEKPEVPIQNPCIQLSIPDPMTSNVNDAVASSGSPSVESSSVANSDVLEQEMNPEIPPVTSCSVLEPSVVVPENTGGENGRTLVAVMGENGLNYLVIPVDQEKNVNSLLQSIQQPTRDKPLSCSTGLPETILNHEFFTRVAGDTVVRDVKSLLSKGYSLQFLVEDEDGSSALVDVLATGGGANSDQVTSTSSVHQNGEVSSQQLVIMASGNVADNLPLALQGILPPSVPIMPSVVDPGTVAEAPLLAHTPMHNVVNNSANDSGSSGHEKLQSCFNPGGTLMGKQNCTSEASSPFGTLLQSPMDTSMCYDSAIAYTDSNSGSASLMEMNLNGKGLGKEGLDYGLGALELPLTGVGSNSAEYMLDSCTTPPPGMKPTGMHSESNTELNTPVKLLGQCIDGTLSADVMAFNFEETTQAIPPVVLSNTQDEKNGDCGDGLTKDFSDLIAADADSSNVMLTIQPADSTAELGKDGVMSAIGLNDNDKEDQSNGSLEWMEGEELMLPTSAEPVAEAQDSMLSVTEQPQVGVDFGTSSLAAYNAISLQGFVADEDPRTTPPLPAAEFSADLDGLLLETRSSSSTCGEPQSQAQSQILLQPKDKSQPQASAELPVAMATLMTDEQTEPEFEERSCIASGPPFTCDICNKIFGHVNYLYRHLRKHTGEFTCIACRAVFARKESLQLHECSAQPSRPNGAQNGRLTCPFCQKQFAAKKQLTRHIAKHTESRRHHCSACDCSFPSKKAMEQHIGQCTGDKSTGNEQLLQLRSQQQNQDLTVAETNTQPQTEILRCSICQHLFLSHAALLRHKMKQHKEAEAEEACPHCGRIMALASAERVEHHVRVCAPAAALQAETANSATCPECDEPFQQLVLYRQHVYRHTHPFACAHCQRAFRSSQERGKHICLGHFEKCSQCGRQFGTVLQLERHSLSHGVPSHHCFECGRSFHLMDAFKQHRCFELSIKMSRRVAKASAETEDARASISVSSTSDKRKTNPSRSNKEQALMCEVCGEVFKTNSSLKAHCLLHGERKFGCGVCGKRFHRKDVLLEHMYVHGDAQLSCPVCNKLLKSKKVLEVHMRQHSDHKWFVCKHCGKDFRQKVNLQKHLEKVEENRLNRRPSQPLNCPQCGQHFQLAQSLNKHLLEHAEGPRFPCSQCSRTFVKEHLLHKHMKIHSVRSHSCPSCGHVLKHRNSLRRHVLKAHPEMAARKKSAGAPGQQAEASSENMRQPQSPEVLLTVSQLQLTTDGVQQLSLTGDGSVEGACLLEDGALESPEDMVLYVLQEPLSCLPLQDSSN